MGPKAMDTILRTPVTDPSAWRGKDLRSDLSWTLRLSSEMRDELETAAQAIQAREISAGTFTQADFPPPT